MGWHFRGEQRFRLKRRVEKREAVARLTLCQVVSSMNGHGRLPEDHLG